MDALYSGCSVGRIETEITFEDGRKGHMRAELAIRDVGLPLLMVEPLPFKKAS